MLNDESRLKVFCVGKKSSIKLCILKFPIKRITQISYMYVRHFDKFFIDDSFKQCQQVHANVFNNLIIYKLFQFPLPRKFISLETIFYLLS